MSAPLTNISENDLFDAIFQRLDEIKRVWKTLKGSLIESLSNFDQFGKSLNKNTRTILGACNPSDPSSYTVLTIRLLTVEDKMSQRYIHFSQSISSQLNKIFDEYSEKIESTHTTLSESANICLKQLTNARQNYGKEKAKYERVCKDTEALVLEKKKLANDPLLFYNLVQQKRVRARLWHKIKELKESEIQVKEAIDVINDKQSILNSTLSDVLKTFRVALKTTLKNTLEAVKRHNKGLGDLIEKNLEDSSNTLAATPQVKDPNEAEEKYIEHQTKRLSQTNLDADIKSETDVKEAGHDETFAEIQKKLLSTTKKLPDLQILMYAEELQRHYEAFCMIADDRLKTMKGLRTYMQELALLWENLSKLVQKVSKTPFPSVTGSFAFYKRTSSHLEPFYNALGALVKKFQNFGTFITMKLTAIDTIMADQKANFKTYQANMLKAIKEHLTCRAALENCFQNQEKTHKKIAEISEKDEADTRLPKMKKDLDLLMVQHVELRDELRRHAVETAKAVTKIEEDFRKVDNTKSLGFKNIIEGILGQENCLYLEISTIVKTANDLIEPDEGIESEVMLIFGQDEKLAECLRYGDTIKGHELALNFQKMYVPPAEYAAEYEKGQIGALGWINPGEFLDISVENVQEGMGNILEEEDGDKKAEELKKAEEAKKGEELKEGEETEKSSPKKLENKFNLKPNEKLLGDFACAILQVIPRQGWMYIYNNKICFSSAKIFGDFVMKFPIKDIVKADKKVISLVFDNALSLHTTHGEVVFTSFFSRDKALSLIEGCMKGEYDNIDELRSPTGKTGLINLQEVPPDENQGNNEDNQNDNNNDLAERLGLGGPENNEVLTEEDNNTAENEDLKAEKNKLLEELDVRKRNIEKSMVAPESFPVMVATEVFNCSAVEAFNALFSDRPVEYNGKKAETVLILTKLEGGDTDIKTTKWDPAPPKSIIENDSSVEGLRALIRANEKSSRTFTFMHPVKEQGIPFLPKACPVDEKQQIYWLNMDEVVIQAEVRSSKVPLSDCFFVRNSFSLKNLEEKNKCEFTWKFGIEFIKSTMFKSKIKNTSQEENIDFAKKIALPLMRTKIAEYVNNQKGKKQKAPKTGGQRRNRIQGEEEKADRKNDTSLQKRNAEGHLDDGLKEILKTYITESKLSQEGMLEEFKGVKFWMMVLTLMNTLILFVLLFK